MKRFHAGSIKAAKKGMKRQLFGVLYLQQSLELFNGPELVEQQLRLKQTDTKTYVGQTFSSPRESVTRI